MQGIIYIGMKQFVEAKHGIGVWKDILKKANLGGRTYFRDKDYPDKEAADIISVASELTGSSSEDIMEAFGRFLVPLLMMLYREHINLEWTTMDMLMHTEEIHTIVRKEMPSASPPKLRFEKVGEKELKLYYNSPRRMAALTRGLIAGVADYYREEAVLSETKLPEGGSEILVTIK